MASRAGLETHKVAFSDSLATGWNCLSRSDSRCFSREGRLDAGATLFDVNSAQQHINDYSREPSLIIRVGMDQYEDQWCERVCLEGANSQFRERRLAGDFISEHNKIFEKHGRVMFGRFEKLNTHWWNLLHNFLNASNIRIGAKLMIVLRKGNKYQGFSTRAFKVGESCPDSRLVPEYYQDLIPYTYVWFEMGELTPMYSNELGQYLRDIAYAIKRRRLISKTLLNAGN